MMFRHPSSKSSRSETEERPEALQHDSTDASLERRLSVVDLEKQAIHDTVRRGSDIQADPGIMPEEENYDDDSVNVTTEGGYVSETQPSESGRGGLAGVVERVVSRASAKSWNPGPPPDGGLEAWTAVASAHLVIMTTWGYINSFGLFETYYSTDLGLPPSTIAWIGSMQIFLLFFIGTFTGRLTDAGYFRPVFFLGMCFTMLGIFTTSVCTSYWQLFLSQGVCMGVGNGCLFCPALATASTYFSTKRSLALGITACGSATGGLIFPAMARQLLPTIGFGWTIRAIGFVQLFGLGIASFGLKTRVPPRKSGSLVEWSAFKEPEYSFYAAGTFSCFLGVYFAFYYISSYSQDIIGLSYSDSLNLLLLLNGVGILGRLIPNYIADRYGAINVFIPTAILTSACSLCWIVVDSSAGLYVWTVIYGIVCGGIQSLFPAGLTSLTTDLRKAGTRMGMVFTINSFATLIGTPIDGALISRCGGKYYGAQAFAGSALLVGAGFLTCAKMARIRRIGGGWKVKV